MRHSTDRILVTHVGSLPRPEPVLAWLVRRESGEALDLDAYNAAMTDAVAAVVRRQCDAGIDVVSDGEQGKASYANYIRHRLGGFSGKGPRLMGADLEDFPGFQQLLATRRSQAPRLYRPVCTGPIHVKDTAPLVSDLARFRAALDAAGVAEGFMNAASPGVIAVFQANRFYPTHEAYLAALAGVMRTEYRAIVDAGFVLQVDCPDLAMGRHLVFKDLPEADFLRHAELQMEALNAALEGIPPDRCRMHLCWGNYEGPHHRDIPLEKLFRIVMKARPQALLFEAANPRHAHEWAVFAAHRDLIPDDRILVPGVIASASNYIEHPELVAERLLRFADIVGRERVMAGSDCGFGTFAGDGLVDPDICYAKLRSMREGADLASARLWGGRPRD